MDQVKIINSDHIGLNHYNKMDEESPTGTEKNTNRTTQITSTDTRVCKWPHQWTLNECCCGCSVRTGSLIIGWFFMLLSSFLLFGLLIEPIPTFLRWEDVLFTCIKLVASILLLIGIYKHKIRVIRISVILSLIDIVVEVVLSIVLSFMIGHPLPFLVVIFILPLSFYFLVIINSLANQMVMGIVPPPHLGMHV